jgi:DNA-binding NtrC family response regulator
MNIGKILIIDDEQSNTEVLKDTLEDVNYSVQIASNATDAKLILQTHTFDLILLDVWMPGQDGMSLLRELKAARNPAKIVMMSGHAEHNDIVEAIKLGATNFIKKPIYDILPLVRNILGNEEVSPPTLHYNFNKPLKQARLDFEKEYFNFHMQECDGNVSKIATISEIERTTLYRKLKELGIDKK